MPKRMNATGEDRFLVPIGRDVAAGESVDIPDEIDALYEWGESWPQADIGKKSAAKKDGE